MTADPTGPAARPRRFYASAEVRDEAEGFAVTLDGRPAKTPGGARLVLPTHALAELVAGEWAAQGETLELASMPALRLAATALDWRASSTGEALKDDLAQEVARYAGSDLLCYFAEGPAALVERQATHWGPVLAWAQESLGLRFVRASGVIHQPQPQATLERVHALAAEQDAFGQVGLTFATALFGSAVLALAVQRAMLSAEAAFELSRLDEAHQEEGWGVDAEAAERTARLRQDAHMLQAWFDALR